jgi:hypothetical protein
MQEKKKKINWLINKYDPKKGINFKKGENVKVFDMSIGDYHNEIGLSSSSIKLILQNPQKFYTKYVLKKEKNKTERNESLKMGSAAHAYLTEREEFKKNYFVQLESLNKNTNKYKALAEELKKSGKEILDKDKFFDLIGMKKSLFNSVIYNQEDLKSAGLNFKGALNGDYVFTGGYAEKSIFWKDKETGLILKSRPDYFKIDGLFNFVNDFKTVASAEENDFGRAIYLYGYYIQAAMELDAVFALTGVTGNFLNSTVEKEYPYCAAFYSYNDALLEMGRESRKKALSIFLECQKNNEWTSYQKSMKDISMPYWAENKVGQMVAENF